MSLLINIRYVKEYEDDPKFLGISLKERNKLDKMVKLCYQTDKNIEVNIFTGSILEEMKSNCKIREDLNVDKPGPCGKALLPEELNEKYKKEKICYCCHKSNFSQTIITVFHELSHFHVPLPRINLRNEGINNLSKYLEFCILSILNEYYAEFNVVRKISNCQNIFKSEFKILLKKEAISYLSPIPAAPISTFPNIKFWINKYKASFITNNEISSYKIIKHLFNNRFNNFFHFMGFWRGFDEIKQEHTIQNNLKKFISDISKDIILKPELLNFLKDLLLKNNDKENLANKAYTIFEEYFVTVFNIKF